ncbi:MAG: hypothetical protein ACI8VR_001906 [Candidatus Azotimanducaceae bacterium]
MFSTQPPRNGEPPKYRHLGYQWIIGIAHCLARAVSSTNSVYNKMYNAYQQAHKENRKSNTHVDEVIQIAARKVALVICRFLHTKRGPKRALEHIEKA